MKTLVLKSLVNRVASQETQIKMFSRGAYKIFKNWSLWTTASETFKSVVSPGMSFLISYSSDSNWYMVFVS